MKLIPKKHSAFTPADSAFFAAGAAVLVAAAGLAVTGTAAHAGPEKDRDSVAERYSRTVVTEEEWYDPTDWFDGDNYDMHAVGEDIEHDGDVGAWHRDDDGASERERRADHAQKDGRAWKSVLSRELYIDGYYDGYFDGQDDDEFGYDVDFASVDASKRYRDGYSAGYYDAHYDKERGYASDWTYYIYPSSVDSVRGKRSAERKADASRTRGDRMKDAKTESMSREMVSKDASDRELARVRGEVVSVKRVTIESDGSNGKPAATRVIEIEFDRGKTVLADLGEKTKGNEIAKGSRVTLCGEKVAMGGKQVLDVERISMDGKVLWNSKDWQKPEQFSFRD